MKLSFLKRYFSIIFIVATFMSVFHHYNDLKLHSDCKICAVSSSILNADIPTKISYITKLNITAEPIVIKLYSLCIKFTQKNITLRVPPYTF